MEASERRLRAVASGYAAIPKRAPLHVAHFKAFGYFKEGTMRYPMRLSGIWKPLLALFGGTPSRSYVDLIDDSIRFRFGTFDESFSVSEIKAVERTEVPLIAGVGWKMDFGGSVGLLGSQKGLVKVSLREPRRVRLVFIPVKAKHIVVSLEDPDAFLEDLKAKISA
jgi:hypothetical protein